MDAFHSLWSKPTASDVFSPSEADILCAVLSALMWRKKNGNIFMVCDHFVKDFLYSKNLDKVWNKIIPSLELIPECINPKTYWAAGKIFALSEFDTPIACIDTDFIVWEKLEFSHSICAIHKEDLNEFSYPDLHDFLEFANDMDFNEKPCNTAFYYIKDREFLNLYTKTAIEFMSKFNPQNSPLSYMLFAEQRLFSMCAKKIKLDIFEVSSLSELFTDNNTKFTHIWGYKQNLRENPDLNKKFCENLKKRIKKELLDFSDSQHFESVFNIGL